MKFLLELLSEEIPARMQAAAAEQLRTRFADALKVAGLAHGAVTADATPRRLWLIADDVAAASEGSAEELKGPAATAPAQAIEGFLKKTGLSREQLEERETPKGAVLFAVIRREGRTAGEILAEAIPQIVREFAWPKSMRWGVASEASTAPRWVRPLTGIVALLDGNVVACAAHGLTAGRETRGHRIHAPGVLSITSAATYVEQLRVAHVLACSAERRQIIASRAAELAAGAGLALIPDEGLVAENAGLTEWPVPLLGRFDPDYLSVPREVIVLTMRTNQKYFALADGAGALAPAFICVANLEANDGGASIVNGNQRVLSARLSDARFFWEQDLATVRERGLEAFLPKLNDIVFHEKLGTVADKVERVAALAAWLCESGAVPADPAQAEKAARLAKADLVSATVGEFPELQGQIGRYLALAVGEDSAVADAIRDHYKPAGQGDDVPTAPVSVAVALADKLDTLVGFFAVNQRPTGSKDPFALRRAMLGVIAVVLNNNLFLNLGDVLEYARNQYVERLSQRFIAVDLFTWADESRALYPYLIGDDWSGAIGFFPLAADKYAGDGPDKELVWADAFSGPREPAVKIADENDVVEGLIGFALDRLRVRLREEGIDAGIVRAFVQEDYAESQTPTTEELIADFQDDPVEKRFRQPLNLVQIVSGVQQAAQALQTSGGLDAAAAYRRVASILGSQQFLIPSELNFDSEEPPASLVLNQAISGLSIDLKGLTATRNYAQAILEVGKLRPLIDKFFTDVMVNDPDPAVRARRLALLARFRDAVHQVADFSKIEG